MLSSLQGEVYRPQTGWQRWRAAIVQQDRKEPREKKSTPQPKGYTSVLCKKMADYGSKSLCACHVPGATLAIAQLFLYSRRHYFGCFYKWYNQHTETRIKTIKNLFFLACFRAKIIRSWIGCGGWAFWINRTSHTLRRRSEQTAEDVKPVMSETAG